MPASPNQKTVLAQYNALVEQGILVDDAAQRQTAAALDQLQQTLVDRASPHPFTNLSGLWQALRHQLKRLVSNKKLVLPRGLYIYGGVGSGKSMLMDLFFDTIPIKAKRRTHFHAFMQEAHELIYAYRQKAKVRAARHYQFLRPQNSDPIPPIAAQFAKQTRLLCFDELQVKDIADASILGRLFTELFARGVVVVATSNYAPDALYAGGLNRHRFLPFIALVKAHSDIICLAAAKDYRLARLIGHPVWFYPLNEQARQNMNESFARLTGGAPAQAAQLTVKTRILSIPQQAQGVARLAFADLCAAHLGVGDYLALAAKYHTLLIDDIPHFDEVRRNQALRFVHLIDTLYEHKVKLIASANVPANALFAENLLVQEQSRTLSRLAEMQSKDYLATAHGVD